MITSAKHEGYILVWAECVARGFQTLFIMLFMREEGVMLIKTSGIDPLRYYDIFEILSLPVQNYNFLSLLSGIGGKIETGCNHLRVQNKNVIRKVTNIIPGFIPLVFI